MQLPQLGIINTIQAFLIPPTQNRLVTEGASITIYDDSGQGLDWDQVAAERLIWEGLATIPDGESSPPAVPEAEGINGTFLIDYTGATKGSSVAAIMRLLNIPEANYVVLPDPNRAADIVVYLRDDYNSCVERDVIAPTEITPTPTE